MSEAGPWQYSRKSGMYDVTLPQKSKGRTVRPRDRPRIGVAMPAPSEQQVLGALATIIDPDLGRDVVSLGMIKDLRISSGGEVAFTFELTTPACPVRDRFKTQAEEIVGTLPGVSAVQVKMTA